jgi:hypothetical protein
MRPGAVPANRWHRAEAVVDSCARSVTHLRDALPRVLVVSSAPATYPANLQRIPESRH